MSKKRLTQILALILAGALVLTTLVSIVVSSAYGEEAEALRDSYALEIQFLEDQQALRVTQRLVFTNRTGTRLDRAMFALYANQFRRQSTVMYEDAEALYAGYLPGGAEFFSVAVNGQQAEWAVQGDGEWYLRVKCDLAPGETCEFSFIYDVLLTENAAFLGTDGDSWRLSGFYPVLCVWENGVWAANDPLQQCRYTLTTPADYTAQITLPERFELAAPGEVTREEAGNGEIRWTVSCQNLREFSLIFSRTWRRQEEATAAGTRVIVRSAARRGAGRAMEFALEALEACEEWFGPLPGGKMEICQTRFCREGLKFAGCVWLDEALFEGKNKEEMRWQIYRAVAEQYFGIAVYADPVADAWLSESVSEYICYLLLEKYQGKQARVERMDQYLTNALKVTIPGNLTITSSADGLNQSQYDIVVRDRGAAAMYELGRTLGREVLLEALGNYVARFSGGDQVTEMDFLSAINDTTGTNWEDFLTEILFEMEEYGRGVLDWNK